VSIDIVRMRHSKALTERVEQMQDKQLRSEDENNEHEVRQARAGQKPPQSDMSENRRLTVSVLELRDEGWGRGRLLPREER
jgi:hypothetical protein